MDTLKVILGSTFVLGGTMYLSHCHHKKQNKFIRCTMNSHLQADSKDDMEEASETEEYLVNPKYIRWVRKANKDANITYDICTKMNGCRLQDTMRVHPEDHAALLRKVHKTL